MMEFSCQNCGHRMNAPKSHAGRSRICPQCKNVIFIPSSAKADSSVGDDSKKPEINPMFSERDKLLLDLEPPEKISYEHPPEPVSVPPEVEEQIRQQAVAMKKEIMKEQAEPPPQRKYPWLFDIFLYPINISGVIHLLAFVFLPWSITAFISLLSLFIPPAAGQFFRYVTSLLALPVYALFYGYICYFIAYCVVDSSQGGLRVPDIGTTEAFDIGDIISQTFLVLGCFTVCFSPAAVYYFFTERNDLWFWLLISYGTFFFPMFFLAGTIFNSFNAFKTRLIIGSIFSTFFPYFGLVLFCGVVGGCVAVILPRLMPSGIIVDGVKFYTLFVLTHVLGRFYWRYKDKLNWCV